MSGLLKTCDGHAKIFEPIIIFCHRRKPRLPTDEAMSRAKDGGDSGLR